jgi:hypothetical protein
MNQVRSIAVVFSVIIFMAGIADGQSRTRPRPKPAKPSSVPAPAPAKRLVTVNLIQGNPVTGVFLRADAEMVEVEVESGRVMIRLNEVSSIVFSSDDAAAAKTTDETTSHTAPASSDPGLPAARKAYAALRKMADAAQIGLPYPQYGPLLIEVRQVVAEATRGMPESYLKNDINLAIEAYTDAGKAWGIIQSKGILKIATEPGASLMKKYDIKPGVNALGQADHLPLDATLGAIWAVAGMRLNHIASSLNQ